MLLILAALGIGITGSFLNGNKERYRDNEIKIERTDKREDEEEADEKT